jgi:hypothetical protein
MEGLFLDPLPHRSLHMLGDHPWVLLCQCIFRECFQYSVVFRHSSSEVGEKEV